MSDSIVAATAGFLRGVGKQAAVSVAASAIAAAALALPGGIAWPFSGGASQKTESPVAAVERWVSPVASDGKIRERHHDAIVEIPAQNGAEMQKLISPAAIVMPMALEWTQPAVEVALAPQVRPAPAGEARGRPLQVQVQAQALPPRRPAAERLVVADAASLRPVQAAMQTAPAAGDVESPSQRSVLGVSIPAPVSRVGDAVSGAVGLVGAAGSWTLARASDLLPRL